MKRAEEFLSPFLFARYQDTAAIRYLFTIDAAVTTP